MFPFAFWIGLRFLSCLMPPTLMPQRILKAAVSITLLRSSSSEQLTVWLNFKEGKMDNVLLYCMQIKASFTDLLHWLHPEESVHIACNFHMDFQHLRVNKRKLEKKASKTMSCNNLFKHHPSFGQSLLSVHGGWCEPLRMCQWAWAPLAPVSGTINNPLLKNASTRPISDPCFEEVNAQRTRSLWSCR